MATARHHYSVITEKSHDAMEKGVYTFGCIPKRQRNIHNAIEEIFKVRC